MKTKRSFHMVTIYSSDWVWVCYSTISFPTNGIENWIFYQQRPNDATEKLFVLSCKLHVVELSKYYVYFCRTVFALDFAKRYFPVSQRFFTLARRMSGWPEVVVEEIFLYSKQRCGWLNLLVPIPLMCNSKSFHIFSMVFFPAYAHHKHSGRLLYTVIWIHNIHHFSFVGQLKLHVRSSDCRLAMNEWNGVANTIF